MCDKGFTSPVIRDARKFQMLLIYATEGSNVHVHVIQGTCTEGGQVWHSHVVTPLENWSHLEVQGVMCFLWAWEYWQPRSINSSWKCTALMWCPGNRLPNGASCFQLAGTVWWKVIKVDNKASLQQKSTHHALRNSCRRTKLLLCGVTSVYHLTLCSMLWWLCYSAVWSVLLDRCVMCL